MEKRKCIFCGSRHSLTREHVIPAWLQEYVGGRRPVEFVGTHANFFGLALDERRGSGNSNTLKKVCGTCNNGWMSRLETKFAEILPRLEADMSPKKLSKSERSTVSSWIIKTGIVAHLSSNYRQILPDDFPMRISRGLVVPGGIKVFGGKLRPKDQILWVQSNFSSLTMRRSDFNNLDLRRHTFVFALQIKGVFIGFAWHGLEQREYRIALPDEQTNQIYPRPRTASSIAPYDDLRQPAMLVRLEPA